MTDQQRENVGALFLNTRRQSDKAPDYVGTIRIGSRDMEICAWVKDGRNGEFLSLKVQEPQRPPGRPGPKPQYVRRPTPEQVGRAEAQRARMMR
ncbi:hypothetical protein HLH33_12085 [Gluconacetobacter diazotrophicus]|uniref:Uncharacterized protein n=1 Tax=Gluconacetobacter diazotrophicus TaxID=33996 RepID=A0A7W4I694_GLUDI|nr:hypothetical protein [Gluconacetobacter diazotrophicus]MBB2157040.1 hypothetical protein [Gluconacetobacter diazotrophicus]